MIVKPDAPLLPTDTSILADSQHKHVPMLAATHTDNGVRTVYAVAYTRTGDANNVAFTPMTLGMLGETYIYNMSDQSGKVVNAAEPYTASLMNPDWAEFVLAPIGKSGIAFLGDVDKIVGTGHQRIASERDQPGLFTAVVTLSPSENSVTLHGYAPAQPAVSVLGGSASPVMYDAASGQFSVDVSTNAESERRTINGDQVQQITVSIRPEK